ncbi:hypothetical protein NHX12_005622 [Muraenolepis orangiensis]|uniref:Uncharacterized protein n=1 Tax=Muraenolepis orangiensis TaxID=630683 RepID=A0A9Q0DRX9_9TELE|nr:hypothetical protein NHX12_005622 [Muraenolepis orangiensis]
MSQIKEKRGRGEVVAPEAPAENSRCDEYEMNWFGPRHDKPKDNLRLGGPRLHRGETIKTVVHFQNK